MLVERVRSGSLDRTRLELAAVLGDEAAIMSCGGDVPKPKNRGAWLCIIANSSKEALVRAACAAARHRMKYWLEENPRDRELEPFLALAEQWVVCPCEPCARACLRHGITFQAFARTTDGRTKSGRAVTYVQKALWFATWTEKKRATIDYCLPSEDEAAIRGELVPWALGERDPLRERVDPRPGPRSGTR